MKRWLAATLALGLLVAAPGWGQDAVVVLQETRVPEPGKKKAIRHMAVLKNTSVRPLRGLRVTVELYDYFGTLLWARTAVPVPSSLGPGATATLSLTMPDLPAHRTTKYRFQHRPP